MDQKQWQHRHWHGSESLEIHVGIVQMLSSTRGGLCKVTRHHHGEQCVSRAGPQIMVVLQQTAPTCSESAGILWP